MGKIFVYELLDAAHAQYKPVQVKACVDDATRSIVGQHAQVLASLVPAAMHLAHQLEYLGCTISDESAFVCSRGDLGRELAA
eukprot:2139158-Pyramimonas_sp.AAC.1